MNRGRKGRERDAFPGFIATTQGRISIVDDDESIRRATGGLLRSGAATSTQCRTVTCAYNFRHSHDDKSHRTAAIDAGAASFFTKPFEANAFVTAIEVALRKRRSFESLAPESADTALAFRLGLRKHNRLRQEAQTKRGKWWLNDT